MAKSHMGSSDDPAILWTDLDGFISKNQSLIASLEDRILDIEDEAKPARRAYNAAHQALLEATTTREMQGDPPLSYSILEPLYENRRIASLAYAPFKNEIAELERHRDAVVKDLKTALAEKKRRSEAKQKATPSPQTKQLSLDMLGLGGLTIEEHNTRYAAGPGPAQPCSVCGQSDPAVLPFGLGPWTWSHMACWHQTRPKRD